GRRYSPLRDSACSCSQYRCSSSYLCLTRSETRCCRGNCMLSPTSLCLQRHNCARDADVANLAKDLLFEYRRSKSLLRALESAERSGVMPGEARVLANKLRISQ